MELPRNDRKQTMGFQPVGLRIKYEEQLRGQHTHLGGEKHSEEKDVE